MVTPISQYQQQTPPSSASIPPSASVVNPTGGVAHTTSSHLPPPESSSSISMQLLPQHMQHPSIQPFQAAAQLRSAGNLQTAPTPTAAESIALPRTDISNLFPSTELSSVALQQTSRQQQLQQHNMAYSSLSATLGASLQQMQQQQQHHIPTHSGVLPQQGLSSHYHSSLMPHAVPPSGSQSARSGVGVAGILNPTILPVHGTHSVAGPSAAAGVTMFSHHHPQQQQTQVRQFHSLTGSRGLDGRLLPPPAKRPAMEYARHPALPQHLPPSTTMLTQQTHSTLGASNFVPINTMGLMLGRASSSSSSSHMQSVVPSVPASNIGFPAGRGGGVPAAPWQQHK